MLRLFSKKEVYKKPNIWTVLKEINKQAMIRKSFGKLLICDYPLPVISYPLTMRIRQGLIL